MGKIARFLKNVPSRRKGLNKTVAVGRSHVDDFVSYEELPLEDRKAHDWSKDGMFVRMVHPNQRVEFIPLANFMRLPNGKTTANKPADGFAADGFAAGTAIRFLKPGAGNDYALWRESW